MGRLNKGLFGLVAFGMLPVAACAQTPPAQAPAAQPTPPAPVSPTVATATPAPATKVVDISGTPALDVITLSAFGPGVPLRFGSVVPNSEIVQLDGKALYPGTDYSMDYAVGVVYLMVAQAAGETLTVGYRYKPGPMAVAPGLQISGLTPFQYALMPGSINMFTGLGMTERTSDGRVMQSNLYGWNNSLKAGGGQITGLYVLGDRQMSNNISGFDANPFAQPTHSAIGPGQSQLVVQDYKTNLLGGNASFDYQDVSRGFTGFGAASASGMDADSVKQLQAERGFTRTGFALSDMRVGGLYISDSYREVKDGSSGISWSTLGMSGGGFKFNYGTQMVDSHFNRFKDLGESNKDQLGKESGIGRSYMYGEYAQKFATLSYSNQRIIDSVSQREVLQQKVAINSDKYKFNMGKENVDPGFMRFDSILATEKTQFGREAGTKREWLALQSTALGNTTPFNYDQIAIQSAGAQYKAQDIGVTSKTWSLQHVDRKVDPLFMSVGTQSDADIDSNVKTVAAMYGTDIKPTPNDRAEWIGTHGLDRKYDGFSSTSLIKGWNVSASELSLKGLTDGGKVDTFGISSKNVLLSYRHENLGAQFDEVTTMMDLEKARLGLLPGLDRTDIDLQVTSGKRKFDAAALTGSTTTGTFERGTLTYDDPNLSIQGGARSVSGGFRDSASLIDPGKDVLGQLQGFNEGDIKVKWQLMPNMTLNSVAQNAYDPETNNTWRTRNNILDWSPDKSTQVNITDLDQKSTIPMFTMFDDSVEKMSVTKNLGRYGVLKLLEEQDSFTGLDARLLSQKRDYLSYEAKIDPTIGFKTEQTLTHYADGTEENINSNTLSKDLSKRAGVSVNDTERNVQGVTQEQHTGYGFWYDLGGGVKVSYGYAKADLPEDQGTSNSSLTIGKAPAAGQPPNTVQPGQIGNVVLGAGYFSNQWETGDRTQTNGNIALSNAKPFNLGSLHEIKFALNLDTATDHATMLHENKLVGASGKIGTNSIGYEYKSQMDPTGLRAIDRTVKLATDPSDKKMLNAIVSYKDRTTTTDQTILIRDYSLMFRPVKNFLLTNQLQTNPEVANTNVLLGSVPQAASSNKWSLDYKQGPNLTMGGSYVELRNGLTNSLSRTAGVNAKLWEKGGSPVTLFYGLEEADSANLYRTTIRYSIEYDQKPASNQMFSLLLGSLSYEHTVPMGATANSLTLRINYQYSF